MIVKLRLPFYLNTAAIKLILFKQDLNNRITLKRAKGFIDNTFKGFLALINK